MKFPFLSDLREATAYLLWCGEAKLNGHQFTPEEDAMFFEARGRTIGPAERMLGVKPEHYEYTPGETYKSKLG